MSYTSNYNLNQRISYLESVIAGLVPFLPINLSNVLIGGNSAGATDIDMNSNDITNVNEIDVLSNTPIISIVDASFPTRFINLDGSVPNITITDGINTNIITPLGSGGTTANTQNVEITDVSNNQTYYPILSGADNGFNPCRVNSIGLTYNAQTEILSLGSLPECSDVPSSNSQLVNKLYVDGFLPPNLSAVLSVGNSAGTNDIDLNGNDLINTALVSGTLDTNITMEALGTGDVILKTGATDRITIDDVGTISGATLKVENVGANSKVAIGAGAGTSQGISAVAVGVSAGTTNQGINSVAVGGLAGTTTQGTQSVAVGYLAGQTSQGANSVAVGVSAGTTSQGSQSVAIGRLAGNSNQLTSCVAIGNVAGQTSQLASSVAIGNAAGNLNQGATAVAVGNSAGNSGQGTSGVAIGNSAGTTSQGASSVAIGVSAGNANQSSTAVAIGNVAGTTGQGVSSVAIGNGAGTTSQGASSVAIGLSAGTTSQLANAVAIGRLSGNANQGISSIAIGNGAGQTSQAGSAVAIGLSAGTTSQLANSVAIGILAGNANQATNAVAIGRNAGAVSQGASSVAIGYNAGGGSQVANSICLNASGVALNPAAAGFFVNPVRNSTGDELIQYNTTSKEITSSNTLTALPECSVVPINANQLVNKSFVNDVILEDFDADTNDNTIVGTNIVFTETGSGVVLYYLGNFSSDIIGGVIGRRGLLQVRSGGSAGTDAKVLSDVIYSLANIRKLTFGFIPLGTETFAAEGRIPIGNVFQILGLSATRQTIGTDATQSVIWRLSSNSATIPTWEFVMNNVVQYTSVLGELTGKWCRVSYDITFDGVDYLVQSTLTNLTDGTTETTAVYPLTTGYVFTPNSIGLYFSTRTSDNNQKFLGVDYCELQQNLYNVGGGNTLNFR